MDHQSAAKDFKLNPCWERMQATLRAATAVLVAVLVAGCADESAPTTEDDSLELPEIEVGASTGGIRGVVIDETIRPVAGAKVTITASGTSTTSDDMGRFAFSNVAPGPHFLRVEHPLHQTAQTSVEVEAGVATPAPVKVLMTRLFEADPYISNMKFDGFFECSQAGLLLLIYSSSNCVTDYTKRFTGPPGLAQPLDNVTNQQREWHADVDGGWASLVWEITWEPTSSGTSGNMGIVVSTYKPDRDGSHWFANAGGASPLRLQINATEQHPTASGMEPTMIPEEGMTDMSFFVSVRQDNWPVPAVALQQDFTVFLTMFHYLPPPPGWSFVAGDDFPY